ncbi:GNAT family N-acetyltransferase [Kineococcus terrestris]|uniref:GNAT family N-acetyltransferase n=1 Tax=Kineococcus terrestris TaxID=2044856 RepID=UPI0034DB3679
MSTAERPAPEPTAEPAAEPVVLRAEDPASPTGRRLREAYWADVAAACGLDAGSGVPAGDEDSLAAPRGTFLVAAARGGDVGCVGVRLLDPGTAEVKRLYVAPAARGLRLGVRLLEAAEEWARARGAQRVVLDTRRELVAALALYARAGYAEVEPYNDNPDAQVWLAKPLAP